MNARRRLQREIVRRRRRRYPTADFTRLTLSNGVRVRVFLRSVVHAHYKVRAGQVSGIWPPTPELLRELGRWA